LANSLSIKLAAIISFQHYRSSPILTTVRGIFRDAQMFIEVYISYAEEDEELASQIVENLES